jgi:hypothetical protein
LRRTWTTLSTTQPTESTAGQSVLWPTSPSTNMHTFLCRPRNNSEEFRNPWSQTKTLRRLS